ncbi:MAG: 6-pyruvoyl tetrahydropterin synthase [Armatimonadetes bacterium]|jgi:6-pyruvoyltetrahydropterin/6-carboxytetrahydropterin synthase|nr:6-pyruvoyl tetrahydropterin synthase [Armatimonadota bacterium]
MVTLTRKTRFSAAHRYFLTDLSDEENRRRFGLCALPNGHGHDYTAEVTLRGAIDPESGMVVNIGELKPIIRDQVVAPLEGEYLTPEHPLLGGRIPACEVLARIAWERLEPALAHLPGTLDLVRLAESRRLWADCRRGKDGLMLTLTRSYEFAAAHRLHSEALSDADNRDLFGKCNNPHGHGHNYVLEVTVGGEPDPRTGLLIDLALLDQVVDEQVVDRYDHRHLNYDIDEFRRLNPTSENLVKVIWDRLEPVLPAGVLRAVTVRETERNVFTYERKDAQ